MITVLITRHNVAKDMKQRIRLAGVKAVTIEDDMMTITYHEGKATLRDIKTFAVLLKDIHTISIEEER